jgi:acyl carrier protein
MEKPDPLRRLLIDFFGLAEETQPEQLTQDGISAWDSLAMVQLIGELQGTFAVDFDLDEIESLRTYSEIRNTLIRKGVLL